MPIDRRVSFRKTGRPGVAGDERVAPFQDDGRTVQLREVDQLKTRLGDRGPFSSSHEGTAPEAAIRPSIVAIFPVITLGRIDMPLHDLINRHHKRIEHTFVGN